MNTLRAVRTHLVAMLFAAGSVVPALGQAQGAMLIGFVKDDLGRPLEGAAQNNSRSCARSVQCIEQ